MNEYYCSVCGNVITAEFTKTISGIVNVLIEPCWKCLKEEKDISYENGYEDGEDYGYNAGYEDGLEEK
jgi:hypothetical protein